MPSPRREKLREPPTTVLPMPSADADLQPQRQPSLSWRAKALLLVLVVLVVGASVTLVSATLHPPEVCSVKTVTTSNAHAERVQVTTTCRPAGATDPHVAVPLLLLLGSGAALLRFLRLNPYRRPR